jgi:hypothetical protein
MPADTRTLSKSDFKTGRECITKLYYKELGSYASVNDDDPYLALLSQGGYMVQQLAKARYAGGREMGAEQDPRAAWAATEEAIRGGDVTLFEATLLQDRQLARVDILQRTGGRLRLIEVKAKSWDAVQDRELAEQGKPREFWTSRGGAKITATWRPYLEDVTYQCLLLESLFPEFVVEPYLCLVDKTARCITDALPEHFDIAREVDSEGRTRLISVSLAGNANAAATERLTIEIPVRAEVDALARDVHQATTIMLASYEPQLRRVPAPIGTACRHCEYRVPKSTVSTERLNGFAECWGPLADVAPSILELHQVSRLRGADALIELGIAGLLDIPDDVVDALKNGGVIAARQHLQITHTRSGRSFLGDGLRPALEAVTYPLYFLDFEAARIAVPFHAGMPPYGLLAFQWSCHVVSTPGAQPLHFEWINTDRTWPNEAFARSLANTIGSIGTVLTWSPFEASTLKTVRDELRDRGLLDDTLDRLFSLVDPESPERARIVDMHRLAAKEFFHPDMGGRTSIKVVLDALWRSDEAMRQQFTTLTGKLGDPLKGPYAALTPLVISGVEQAVAEGTGAIRAYEAMMFGVERHDAAVQAAWRQLLLEYCKLDTLAMVLIWDCWQRSVKDAP